MENWIAAARLTVIQHRIKNGREELTKETEDEIMALQKLAFPHRPRGLRKHYLKTLDFAPRESRTHKHLSLR